MTQGVKTCWKETCGCPDGGSQRSLMQREGAHGSKRGFGRNLPGAGGADGFERRETGQGGLAWKGVFRKCSSQAEPLGTHGDQCFWVGW